MSATPSASPITRPALAPEEPVIVRLKPIFAEELSEVWCGAIEAVDTSAIRLSVAWYQLEGGGLRDRFTTDQTCVIPWHRVDTIEIVDLDKQAAR